MNDNTFMRWTDHDLIGQLVTDQATGRIGTLAAVARYISRETGRTVRAVAHLRPIDGSGREWTANPANLTPADDETRHPR